MVYDLFHVYIPRIIRQPPTVALRGMSLAVYRGEVFGLLGPNGAGKTTTIGLLTCNFSMAAPTQGDCLLGGHSISQSPKTAFPHLGLCPQFDALWMDITVLDNLRVFARIKGVSQATVERYIESFITRLDLKAHRNKTLKYCSGGTKRRVSVATAFCGNPDIILLDEPSSGIDPLGRRKLADLIRGESGRRAVIITTHSMEEAEALSSRIGIMVNGELHCLNTSLSIKNKYGSGVRLEVLMEQSVDPNVEARRADFVTTKLSPSARQIDKVASRLLFELPVQSRELGRLFTILETERHEIGIKEYALSQPTLEQVFIRFAKRQRAVAMGQTAGSAI